jgi:hypothetical protein
MPEITPPKVQPKCACKPNQSCTKDGKSNEEAEALIRKFLSDREEAFKLVEMMRSIPDKVGPDPNAYSRDLAYSTRNLKYPDPSEVEGKVDDRIFRCLAFSLIMAIVSFVLGFLWK